MYLLGGSFLNVSFGRQFSECMFLGGSFPHVSCGRQFFQYLLGGIFQTVCFGRQCSEYILREAVFSMYVLGGSFLNVSSSRRLVRENKAGWHDIASEKFHGDFSLYLVCCLF